MYLLDKSNILLLSTGLATSFFNFLKFRNTEIYGDKWGTLSEYERQSRHQEFMNKRNVCIYQLTKKLCKMYITQLIG